LESARHVGAYLACGGVSEQPSRRRVSAIWMIFQPSAVRANWNASTPQWLNVPST
jgi:hypothetical protein